jgi:acyl carrier protein
MKLKSQAEIIENISSIFSQLLKKEVLGESDIARENEPLWDSLMNLELIISLEDFFGVQFSPEEIECMDSNHNIQNILFKKLNDDL